MKTQQIINELNLDDKIKKGRAKAQDFIDGCNDEYLTYDELKEMFYPNSK